MEHKFHAGGVGYETVDAAKQGAQAAANRCGRVVQVVRDCDHVVCCEAYPREVIITFDLDPL